MARGWPMQVPHTWYKEALSKRWNLRINPVEKDAKPNALVMATKYNTIWDSVNLSIVRDAIHNEWVKCRFGGSTERQLADDVMDSRIVIAFSRTSSFGDLVNNWNKEVIAGTQSPTEQLDEEGDHLLDLSIREWEESGKGV